MTHPLAARLRAELARAATEPLADFERRRDTRLAALLHHHYAGARNPAYRALLRRHGITADWQVPTSAHALESLPIMEKDLLRASDYASRPAANPREVRFTVRTSGSTGSPMSVPQTFGYGRRVWGEHFARFYLMAGDEALLEEPVYFVAHYTATMRDTGTYAGCTQMSEALGEGAVMGNTSDPFEMHLKALLEHGARSACSAPGFFVNLLGLAEAEGHDLRRAPLAAIFPGGAPVSPENFARLKDGFGLRTLRLGYVGSELGWMGLQVAESGPYALFGDEFVVEVVDDAGRQVAPGQRGRVLVTALGNTAAPIIRYANGDSARYLGTCRDVGLDAAAPYANFPLLDEFARDAQAIIGDGKVSYEDLAEMPRAMATLGAAVNAFQLAKRLSPDGRDQIHLRVELVAAGQDAAHVTEAAITALRRHPQMDFHLADGELPWPVVETYAPGQLTAGRFKVPLYADETRETHDTGANAPVREPVAAPVQVHDRQ
jgi:phenylacetate-coenzyme A ligase PaaK-like adenylate-forming protein